MNKKTLLRIVAIVVRIAIFVPGFYAVCIFVDEIVRHDPLLLKQPILFWCLDGYQGIWGLLCLSPYPGFLFRKGVRIAFMSIIVIGSLYGLWRTWLPTSYDASVKILDAANHIDSYINGSDGFYDIISLLVLTVFALGPLVLFFIRDYEVRYCAADK